MDKTTKNLFDSLRQCDVYGALKAIESGADVNAVDDAIETPLMLAIGQLYEKVDLKEQLRVIDALIEKGALNNSDHPDLHNAETALHVAVLSNCPEIIERIEAIAIDPELICRVTDNSPAHTAARFNHPISIKTLDALGVDIDTPNNESKETPLMIAIRSGAVEAAQMLIECGADVNAECGMSMTPLFYAARSLKKEQMTRLLLEGGADPNIHEYWDKCPVIFSAEHSLEGNLQAFFESGALNLEKRFASTLTYLEEIIINTRNPHEKIVKMFVEAGALDYIEDKNIARIIQRLHCDDRSDIVSLFLRNGVTPNLRILPDHKPVIFHAIEVGATECVKALLAHGAALPIEGEAADDLRYIVKKCPEEEIKRIISSHIEMKNLKTKVSRRGSEDGMGL